MEQIILIIQVIAAISLIVLVLIQHGKGAEVGASFGSGASQTIFGSQGSASFVTRLTAIMATFFFLSTLGLGYLAAHRMTPQSLDNLLEKVEPSRGEIPETPAKEESAKEGQKESAKEGKEDISDVPQIPAAPKSN